MNDEEIILNSFNELKLNSTERFQFIDSFLENCNAHDLFYLSQRLDELKKDFFSILPLEVTGIILSHLSWKDLLTCCRVSHIWNKKISNNYNIIWKKWCEKEFLTENHIATESENEQTNFKNIFLDLLRHTARLDEGSAFKTYSLSPAEMNAMACYRNIIATATNSVYFWRLDEVDDVWCIFKSFELESMACDIKFDDVCLVVSAYYFTINLYSLETDQLIAQFTGHTASITCFDFNQSLSLIVSGSADTSIKFWSMNEKHLVKSETYGSWPTKITILVKSDCSYIVILYTDGIVHIRSVVKLNDELTFVKKFVLNAKSELNDEESPIYLSNKSRFTFTDNVLTGFFISENNSNETVKFFFKKWTLSNKLSNEFEVVSFDNSGLDFLNKFSLFDLGQFNIVAFGFNYCLFVNREDRIYLSNLKSQSIECIQNELINRNKKLVGLFHFPNIAVGRKENFKMSETDWLSGYKLADFTFNSKKFKNSIVFCFHGLKMNEIFLVTWKT